MLVYGDFTAFTCFLNHHNFVAFSADETDEYPSFFLEYISPFLVYAKCWFYITFFTGTKILPLLCITEEC